MASLSVQALSLVECRRMARDNYPVIKQYRLIVLSRDFTLENVSKGWLPQVSASAGAYAFTDMLKTNGQMARMGVDMRNYVASTSVVVQQNVYDGGQMAAQRQVATAQADVQKHQLDVSVYAINERVDQLYFSILLLDEQLSQNELLLSDLATSEQTVRSMVRGGLANQADLEAILVEELKASQQKVSHEAARNAYLRMLEVFVGRSIGEGERLEKPSTTIPRGEWGQKRPELSYYASQDRLLAAQRKQLDARLRPKVSLMGLGMIHSKVSDWLGGGFLAGGVTVSWNIGALYTRKNDISKLDVQQAVIDSQRETFLFDNRLQNEEANGAITSLRKQLAQDDEIVRLRESIRHKADKRAQLGTESVNDLVRDINAVSLARAQRAQHEIQLLKEIYRQQNINNQ